MASVLTWLSASQLAQQTQHGVYSRAETLANAAAAGISDWISIRKDIATAFNDYTEETQPVPYLKQARNAGGFDDMFFGTPQGEMYRSHPERNRADYDPRVRPWYIEAKNSGKQLRLPRPKPPASRRSPERQSCPCPLAVAGAAAAAASA